MNTSDSQDDLLKPEATHPPTSPPPASLESLEPADEIEALWGQIYRLQTTLAAILVALIFLSVGMILFMGKQMTSVRARLHADRQSAKALFADFQQNTSPKIRSFVRSLQAFSTTNQDFVPILEKYQAVLSPYYAPRPSGSKPVDSNLPPPTTEAPPSE